MQSIAGFPSSRGPFQRGVARGLLVVFLATLPGSPPVRAEIAGEQVISGDVSFQQEGNVTTIHASDGAIIHYDQLDVWAHEQLHFVQPDSSSRVLNRVFGDATHIDGGLFANGIVYIVNPAGIFFGAAAVVDVGGLYAAAGNLNNEDFLAGTDRFELSGPVINAGHIEAMSVALLGTTVANHGSIVSPDGTIALVAGEQVVLTRLGGHLYVEVEGAAGHDGVAAIEQTGTVDADAGEVSFTTGDVYSLALNHEGITRGGTIELRAASGLVQVAGLLDASDRRAGATGGDIAVTGEQVALLGAELDASGDAGGGTIRVGGDLRGGGALPTARRTYVDDDSVLRADAITSGDGGRVIVWADEATAFHGALTARGGATGGDGGFAEISGALFLSSDGDVDLRAAHGANGTLLYDPQDIRLVGGIGEGSDTPDLLGDRLSGDTDALGQILFADVGNLSQPFQIFESEIEGTDANVVLEATNSITTTGAGTFVNNAGEGVDVLRISDGNSLTMRTRNSAGDATGSTTPPGINLAGLSLLTTGGGSVALSTGDGDIAVAGITTRGDPGGAGGAVTLAAGGTGSVTAGAIDTSGGAGATTVGGAGGAVSITTIDGAITVASVSTSGGAGATDGGAGGKIDLLARDLDMQRDSHVTVSGNLVARGGAGSAGVGGAGGAVLVRSDGANATLFPNGSPAQVIAGGGNLSLADVDTRGGAGTTSGGRGGNVRIETTDGAIAAGDLDASGGAGGTNGGSAGQLVVLTRDADMNNANDIAVGDLRAVGGTGASGAGGAGAFIDVRTQASVRIVEQANPQNVLQEATGGGDVTIASMDSSGGDGGTVGGSAGTSGPFSPLSIRAAAAGDGNDLTVAGTTAARGGAGADGNGGSGRNVDLTTQDGDLTVSNIVTTGGTGANAAGTALGGNGGQVTLSAGDGSEDGGGDIALLGNIDAREGASGASAAATALQGLDGGDVTIIAADNLEHGVQAGPYVNTTGDVSLTAGGGIGQVNGAFLVQGSGERRTDANLDFVDHDALFVTAGGNARVSVVNPGFLRLLSATATDVAADIRVTQAGAGTGDVIAMAGSAGQMVVTQVDSTDNNVDVAVRLDNLDDAASDGTLVLATGSVTAGRAFDALSEGDLVVGTTDGTVIDASAVVDPSPLPGASAALDSVLLVADADEDGTGALRDAAGAATGVIDLNAALPVALVMFAGEGIGEAGAPIVTSGGGRVSALNRPRKPDADPATDGVFVLDPDADTGIFLRNGGTGDLSIVDSTRVNFITGASVAAGTGDIQISVNPGSRIVLDTPSTITSGGMQVYNGDVAVKQDATLSAGDGVRFAGALDDADADVMTTSRATVTAGGVIEFAGDVGATSPLSGLVVRTPARILFSAASDQSVETLGSGIQLNPAGRGAAIPVDATIAKTGGDLSLVSTGGPVILGDGEKLSGTNRLLLSGDTVRFTDLSALDISVQSPSTQIFARIPGTVLLADGRLVGDVGTDILANTVAFDIAPTVVGAGNAPRIATLSGSAQNAGGVGVSSLLAPITSGQIFTGSNVLDLALLVSDPGHETPELLGDPVEVPLELYPSDDTAAPGAPLSSAEIVAFLACAPLGDRDAPPGCAPAAQPPYGSALDTERATEVAEAYRELLGDSERARSGRADLARAAADPGARLPGAASPAGRAYLVEIARLLAQTRMLGLEGPTYGEVRGDLLAALVAAIGSPQLDAARLAAAVEASAMGMAI